MNSNWSWKMAALLIAVVATAGHAEDIRVVDSENAALKGEMQLGPRYHYNIYRDFNRAIGDGSFDLNPEIYGQTKPSSLIYVVGEARALYQKFYTADIQSHLDYEGALAIKINEKGSSAWTLQGEYQNFYDPSPSETYGKILRTKGDGWVKSKWKGALRNYLDVDLHVNFDQVVNPKPAFSNTNFLSNITYEGLVQYNSGFLPETHWFIRGTGGVTQYPNKEMPSPSVSGINNSAKAKSDSTYGFAELGLLGRLTEKSTIDCATGYLMRLYAADDSFSGPVFYLRFTEQVTRRDQLLAGYNYVVKDSYWSNYLLDQEIYIGLAHVMGDQLLLMGRIGYNYTSYSKPDRRDDQRITAGFMAKYSLSKYIKLAGDFKMDLLASDAYDNSSGVIPDRPVSYKYASLGLSLITNF